MDYSAILSPVINMMTGLIPTVLLIGLLKSPWAKGHMASSWCAYSSLGSWISRLTATHTRHRPSFPTALHGQKCSYALLSYTVTSGTKLRSTPVTTLLPANCTYANLHTVSLGLQRF